MECCGSTQLFVRQRQIQWNRKLSAANEKLWLDAALHTVYLLAVVVGAGTMLSSGTKR